MIANVSTLGLTVVPALNPWVLPSRRANFRTPLSVSVRTTLSLTSQSTLYTALAPLTNLLGMVSNWHLAKNLVLPLTACVIAETTGCLISGTSDDRDDKNKIREQKSFFLNKVNNISMKRNTPLVCLLHKRYDATIKALLYIIAFIIIISTLL